MAASEEEQVVKANIPNGDVGRRDEETKTSQTWVVGGGWWVVYSVRWLLWSRMGTDPIRQWKKRIYKKK